MDNSINKIQICSIDIGKKNLCFYIQEIDILELSKIKNIPLKDRYNTDGSLTNQMKLILDQIYKNGKTILFKNNDITENCKPKLYFDPEFFHNINDLFDSYLPYFNNCSYLSLNNKCNLVVLNKILWLSKSVITVSVTSLLNTVVLNILSTSLLIIKHKSSVAPKLKVKLIKKVFNNGFPSQNIIEKNGLLLKLKKFLD